MAQELSTSLTNSVAEPRLATNSPDSITVVADTMEVADGANNDTAVLNIRIPVDARVRSVRVATDDLGGTAVADVGLFRQDNAISGTTFTVVDADAFRSGLDVSGAAVALTEVRFAARDINTVNQPAWQLAGLSAKPEYGELLLGLTFTTQTATAGTVTAIVEYST